MRAHRLSRRRQAGLTLVEIIIVFLVLGFLTSMALPRALNLGAEARRTKAEALHERVRAATLATRERALNRAQTDSGPEGASEVELDGVMIQTNFGYPEASTDGIVRAARIDPAFDLVHLAGGGSRAGTALTLVVDGAHGSCEVLYRSPLASNAPPTITLSTKGC